MLVTSSSGTLPGLWCREDAECCIQSSTGSAIDHGTLRGENDDFIFLKELLDNVLNVVPLQSHKAWNVTLFCRRVQVSNHAAAVDDPFVISSILAPHKLLNSKHLRWTLCASDKCFGNAATSAFFRSVKVLPLTKGHGVFQEV